MRSLLGIPWVVRLAGLGLIAGLLTSVLSTSPAAGQRLRAPATPTPAIIPTPTSAPIPVRKVGWLNSAAARAPEGLQRTVVLPSGGGGGTDDCDLILLAPGAAAWRVNQSSFVVGAPHETAFLAATYCGDNPDPGARFFLTDPTGNTWELPVTGDRTQMEYELPVNAAEGTYRLTITTHTGRFEVAVSVYQYNWTRLTLWDVVSPAPRTDYSPGESMYADYFGFEPGSRLEVGLYRTAQDGMKQTLIDLWQVTIGPNGRFVETLPIPTNASAGTYALIACDLSNCKAHLDRLRNQLATSVTWEEFTITYPASVSSAVGVDGLPLWSTLSAGAQAERLLWPGEPVRVLEGPIKQQNRLWYRIHHSASGLEGWVLGDFLNTGSQ